MNKNGQLVKYCKTRKADLEHAKGHPSLCDVPHVLDIKTHSCRPNIDLDYIKWKQFAE